MVRRFKCSLALMVALQSMLPVFSSAESGVTDKEIVVGSCNPLSGKQAVQGQRLNKGVEIYFDYINKQGGVHGRSLKLMGKDDKFGSGEVAVECLNELIDSGAFAGTTMGVSAQSSKYVRIAEAKKFPIVGFTNGSRFLVDPFNRYVFVVRPTFMDEASRLIDRLWTDLGRRKIAVIYQNDIGGLGQLEGVTEALKAKNAAPVATAPVQKDFSDLKASIEAARAANPDAVVLGGNFTTCGEIAKKIKELGWKPEVLASIGGRDNLVTVAADAAEGMILNQIVPPLTSKNLPAVALYLKLSEAAEEEPNSSGFEGFLNAWVMVEGLKRAQKDLTREKFVDAMETMKNLDIGLGPTATISYGKDSHRGLRENYFSLVKRGRPTPLTDWKTIKVK